ncbi:uncharacterized protein LOC126810682 [Patella vulgata]|uniref:uncharacterized protein LOC126810682 n=1 Tax=Patella vulgata TaxID=6465 RepID=UPI0024A9D5FA|nr:uncharacterized protein LOC126810682 [Patella vulgata]
MKCKNPKCHYNLDPSFSFCPKCAVKIDNKIITEPSSQVPVEYQESSPDAKRRNVIPRREKGKMLPEDDDRIISNYVYLIENLIPLQPLLDSLTEIYVLNEDDLEVINGAESGGRKAMIRTFLDILRACGRHAYSKFIHCLNKSGYGAVAEQLSPGEQTPLYMRVAVIGKTGVGKSHLGNLLLHRDYFKCSNSMHSCTSVCSNGERALDADTNLTIMDTPGLFDTRDDNTKTVKKFLSIFKFTGIHIFLMVVRIDVRFTEEEENALRSLCDVFGEDINDHLIVILNNQSQKIKSKENLLHELPTSIKNILDRCKHRCLVLNYVSDVTVDGNPEIEAIINTIKTIVTETKGRSYTHQMFREAEKAYTETLKQQTCDLEKRIRRLERENNELKKSGRQNITLVQQNPLPKPERVKTKYQTDAENLLDDATSKQFVETRAFEEGKRILEEHFILGIIGAVGDGKTVLCRMIANSFLKVHTNFIPLEIRHPRDMDTIRFTDEDSYLMIIDDMFGIWTSTLKQQIHEWPKHFESFFLAKQKRNSAIIYVMRNDVYQACQHLLRKYEIFSMPYQLQLHGTQFQLSKDEKKDILRYHFRNCCDIKLEKMLEHSSGCFGFPDIVSLCSKTWTGQTTRVLNSLFEFLRREYDIFWNEDRIKYMALLVIFSPQPISEDEIRQKTNHLIQTQIQQEMGNPGGVEDILDSCKHLTGSYVLCDDANENRMFLPEKVIRCFLLHVSQRFIKLAIKYCPFELLIDHVSTAQGDQNVFMQPHCYVDLYERFSRELREGNKAVLFHQAFLESNFLHEFLNRDSAEVLLNPELKMQLGVGSIDEGHFLHYVCLLGYLNELQIVFSYYSKTTANLSGIKTKLGFDLLSLAAKSEKEVKDKINYLRDQKYVMERQSKADIQRLIRAAVQSNSLDTLKHVSTFTDIDFTSVDLNQRTVLHYACDSDYDIPEIVKYIVEKGADIDAKDENSRTPLILAIQRGKILTINCLIKLNSSVNVTDKDEKLPIHVAANSNAGRLDIDTSAIIELLVEAGSPINAKDACGRTPLTEARAKCDEKMVDVLLENGADTDDTYDHLLIDEESKGMTIADDVKYSQTSIQNNMATTCITIGPSV